jgi:esterase/lipase
MDKLKRSLIFLHGMMGTAQDMEPIMAIFREKNVETYSFNFSGHGINASQPTDFRIDLFAQDLDKFITLNHIHDPIIFGYSIGGLVALYHKANVENSSIKMIFTYGTKFNWKEQYIKKELPFLDPIYLSEKFPKISELYKKKHGDRWKQVALSTAHMLQNLEKLDELRKEDLQDIDIPVIFILGDQDRVVTSEETQLTSTWIRGATFKTISHSKHELERSNLREIAQVVFNHID